MDIPLSNRVKRIKPSPTLAVSARAAALKAEGKDVIGLGVGEPDFDTPDHIKDEAIKAIQEGFTKYTPVDGTPALKQAIISKFSHDNGLDYQANQVLVSVGAKQSLFNLTQALLEEGDEAVIPAPYWVSYPDMVLLADAKPVFIETRVQARFKITPEQLEQAITPKTKLLFLNSPSNPSGVCYSKEEFAALGEILRNHPQVFIVTDDIYEHIRWNEGPFVNILNACPDLYDRTIVINGVSKCYAMTGWRIGYAAGPAPLIAAMKKVQSQSTSNPCSVSQVAAQAALEGGNQMVKAMVEEFKDRHDYVLETLQSINGFECTPADGTFYIFPNVQKVIDRLPGIDDDVAFAELLLNKVGVALVPGSAFGSPGCIRLSFATSMEVLKDALGRIQKAVEA